MAQDDDGGYGRWWWRRAVAAMDGGDYEWCNSGARWRGGGVGRRGSGKEVRWRLHGAVVLDGHRRRWSDEDGTVAQGR
jgi:hypothetical protein